MERITALKTEGERGEEPEVRRAAVVALRQIARRNIEISGPSLDVQVEPLAPPEEGVRVAGGVSDRTTLQKGEVISHIIDNKKIASLQDYNILLTEAMESNEEVTFGLPKIVKVRVSKMDELGIEEKEIKSEPSGKGVVVGKMTIDSKARKMGIEKGETISHINNQKVSSLEDYRRIIAEAISKSEEAEAISEGAELTFRVADEDKYRLMSISVPEDSRDLGMVVQELPAGAGGVLVTAVRPWSPAVEAGVRKGQTISYIVSKREIHNMNEYQRYLREGLEDSKVTISVINKTAIHKLIQVLRNKGLIVRFDAAQALGEVKHEAAVDSLIEILEEQANPIEIGI
jgi:S1-C subfamily serine protease